MIKITKNISTKVIIILLFFITQGFAKNLPPGSGEGDLPANVLILLDKSGSMNVSSGTSGIPTRYPYRLAVGSTTVDGGEMYFITQDGVITLKAISLTTTNLFGNGVKQLPALIKVQ